MGVDKAAFSSGRPRLRLLANASRCLGAMATCIIPAAAGAGAAAPFSTPEERCILPASSYHRVNAHVLRAILRVESGLNPTAINRNRNGTFDLGIGQMNSAHFPQLAAYGVAPAHLLDGCVATYVAAWHLSGLIRQYGNSWTTIARYHSATPYLNVRYQILLSNELVRAGVLAAPLRTVPPIESSNLKAGRAPSTAAAGASLVVDQ